MSQHVLLIEDEPNIIEAIRFLLSREGFRVSTHSDGASAMTAIRRESPDLVILDVMLPGRSGMDVLADLRGDMDLAQMPVLMLTARGQTRDRDMAEQAGVSLYMTKPFSNAEVLDAVRALLAGVPQEG